MSLRRFRESMAASVGPGWRSQGTNIGTGAVIKTDAAQAAKDWALDLGRKPTERDRGNWGVQAQRLGIDADDEETAWQQLQKSQAESGEHAAMITLRKIFGDSLDETWSGKWSGWMIPLAPEKRQVQPDGQDREFPEDANPNTGKKKPKYQPPPTPQDEATVTRGGAFLGYPVTPQASEAPPADIPDTGSMPAPGFPFHTRSAERIWVFAQKLILTHPEAPATEIIRMAAQESRLPLTDLTPEDITLLQMAVDWAQNGPAKTSVRTGGTPGGPFRSGGGWGAP